MDTKQATPTAEDYAEAQRIMADARRRILQTGLAESAEEAIAHALARRRSIRDDMLAALKLACATAEKDANWDKPPQSVWYYQAKTAIAKAEGK